jgi:16S rRNA (guanine527-N7)-methyltransferase
MNDTDTTTAHPLPEEERRELAAGASQLGLALSDGQLTQLLTYAAKVASANETFNLTRIPRSDYVKLHLLDSLTALQAIPPDQAGRLLDVGTGAGFPGVPLACALPRCSVTLLDSTAKKVQFAANAAHESGITNCMAIHNRAELLAKEPSFRQVFDIVVSRAVAPMERLLDLMLPLTKPGGMSIALKGAAYQEEIAQAQKQLKKHKAEIVDVIDVAIPGTDITRHIIVVRAHNIRG